MLEYRAEGRLERAEPRFIGTPLAHTAPVKRLAYLIAAQSAHRSLVFMEAQALFLERQSEIFEQPPDFQFRICDQILVQDAVNSSRQHTIEVHHQADVVAIMAADVTQIVRESLATRKIAPKAGPAAIERVPPRVNDFRLRQHQMNQT